MTFIKKISIFVSTIFLLPQVILASGGTDLGGVARLISSVLGALVPLIIGLALLFFLWGMLVYLWNGDDEDKREESKSFMLWGVIGLFVMVSVWGLVSLVANSFNFHLPGGLVPTLPNKE